MGERLSVEARRKESLKGIQVQKLYAENYIVTTETKDLNAWQYWTLVSQKTLKGQDIIYFLLGLQIHHNPTQSLVVYYIDIDKVIVKLIQKNQKTRNSHTEEE